MSFFEPVQQAAQSPQPARRGPLWVGPPDNWVPQTLPASLIVSRSDDAVVTVSKIAVFPTGFEFDLTTLTLTAVSPDRTHFSIGHGRPSSALVGVEYANGAKATLRQQVGGRGQGMTLLPQGGTGSDTAHRLTIWVTPLPPDGPVIFAAAWAKLGVPEATVALEGAQFRGAAERAVQLWPDEVDSPVEADFSDAPALPTEGARPVDADQSEQDIRAAFSQVFDNGPQAAADPLAAVQDGAALSFALAEVRSRFPVEAATTRVAVGRVAFLDDVRAAVTFRFLVRTALAGFGTQLGYAVRERGQWKVARDTYCRVLGWAGVPCPPPPPAA